MFSFLRRGRRRGRLAVARWLWPKNYNPEADYYRFVRDCLIERYGETTTDEERLDAAWDALDSLYSYFLAHGLMVADSDAQVAHVSGWTEEEVRAACASAGGANQNDVAL